MRSTMLRRNEPPPSRRRLAAAPQGEGRQDAKAEGLTTEAQRHREIQRFTLNHRADRTESVGAVPPHPRDLFLSVPLCLCGSSFFEPRRDALASWKVGSRRSDQLG